MGIQSKNELEFYVRTVHDEREYISVLEVFYYDKSGEEIVHKAATNACFAQFTCGDMADRYSVLKDQVEACLEAAGIKYYSITMDNEF